MRQPLRPLQWIVGIVTFAYVWLAPAFSGPLPVPAVTSQAAPWEIAAATPAAPRKTPTATPEDQFNEKSLDTPVLAYYTIRHTSESWNRAKSDFPLIGRYTSDDQSIMRQHIRWAQAAGIDGFIVNWRHTDEQTKRLRALIDVSSEEDFKLAVTYEALDVQQNRVPAPRIAADFDYFAQELSDSPVFDLFGKPVIIWYGSWEFSREEIEIVTPQRRDRLHILASERNPEDYRNLADLFDGNAYYWSSVNPATFDRYRYEEKLQSMGGAVHESKGIWIAPAAPGFDSRMAGGDRVVDRAKGSMLRTQLSAALASEPDAVGLISWNEFSDNSHVEPSCLYGVEALEVLARLLGGTAPDPVPCGDDMTPVRAATVTGSPAATPLQFSVEGAESSIALMEESTPRPVMREITGSDQPPAAGAPTLRFATLSLLVIFGGFLGGCSMVMLVRTRRGVN